MPDRRVKNYRLRLLMYGGISCHAVAQPRIVIERLESDVDDETKPPAPQERGADTESAAFVEDRASDELNCDRGKEAEVISLLLEEYGTLRAEIIQRLTARVQVAGFIGAGAALLVATSNLTFRKPNLYFAFVLVLFAWYWWHTMSSGMYRIAIQLQRLEGDMNRLAARAYGITGVSKGPFTWETMRVDERSAKVWWVRWQARLSGSAAGYRRGAKRRSNGAPPR